MSRPEQDRRREDWQALNAYVDGELTPNEAAEIARRIAQDPATAESAATLSSLKSALLEQSETPADFVLLPREATGTNASLWQAGHTVAAAAVLVVCMAATAIWHWDNTRREDQALQITSWHQEAAGIHRNWIAKKPDQRPPSLNIPATAALSAPKIQIPDLSDSGLTAILLEPEAQLGGMSGYRIGYGGTRGCRISFFVLQGDGGIPAHLIKRKQGGPQALAWRHDRAHYLLLAEGMAETRFDLIAQTLQNMTSDWRPLSPEIRTALQQNRQASAPCTV